MTIVVGVPVNIVYIAGALQMYGQTLIQRLSAQYPSRHIDTQSESEKLSGSLDGRQFTNSILLLSDVQVNVPSTDMSFPPIQYSQHLYHEEHESERKKNML